MTTYRILFEGSVAGAPERGFSVAVVLEAPDAETAEARARLKVYRAWTDRGHLGAAGGVMPDLTVSAMGRVGPLRALVLRKGTGALVPHPA